MNNKPTDFIEFLIRLDNQRETGVFARLRRGIGDSFADLSADIAPYVSPFVEADNRAYRYFALVGSLFASHRNHAIGESLGRSFAGFGDSDSLQKRFKSLLRAQGDELIKHLREAVSLAKAKDVALDYAQLLNDLKDWDKPSQEVQFRWARDYWRGDGMEPAKPEDFVSQLSSLKKDRAALAALRRGLGKKWGDVEMLPYVAPYLPEKSFEYPAYFLVAALFGRHPQATEKRYYNMGDVFRLLVNQGGGDDKAQSLVKRFIALLDADARDLPHHLRQAVDLAASKDMAINYLQLLRDVLYWSHPDKTAQQRWAGSFWNPRPVD